MNITTTFGLMETSNNELLSIEMTPIYYEHDDTIEKTYELESINQEDVPKWEVSELIYACLAKCANYEGNHNSFTYPIVSKRLQKRCKVVAIHRLDNGLTYYDDKIPQTIEDIFGNFENLKHLASHDTISHEVNETFVQQFSFINFKSKRSLNDFYVQFAKRAWLELAYRKEDPQILADKNVFITLIKKSLIELGE
jgi:hypothetical protein